MLRLSFLLFLFFSEPLIGEIINSPVVNIYLNPQLDSEVNTQGLYGSTVSLIEELDGLSKIRTPDGAQGWVESSQISSNDAFEKSENLRTVKSLFAHIYRVSDLVPYPPILTLPYGSKIKLENVCDTGERWVKIELISGETGWIQRGDVAFEPKLKTLEEVIVFSHKFLGLPYTWGGTSSYGFDCSGFVQMLCKEMGLLLPRNACDQMVCDVFLPVSREELQRGDFVFFGESGITHVGLYLGDDVYIHSGVRDITPMVMISSLTKGKYHFVAGRRIDPSLLRS